MKTRIYALAMLLFFVVVATPGCLSPKVHEVSERLKADYDVSERATRLKDPPVDEADPTEWKAKMQATRAEFRANLGKLEEVSR